MKAKKPTAKPKTAAKAAVPPPKDTPTAPSVGLSPLQIQQVRTIAKQESNNAVASLVNQFPDHIAKAIGEILLKGRGKHAADMAEAQAKAQDAAAQGQGKPPGA